MGSNEPVLAELIRERGVSFANGATGTNLMAMGLTPGDAPELWNVVEPGIIRDLHRGLVDTGTVEADNPSVASSSPTGWSQGLNRSLGVRPHGAVDTLTLA